jgi:vacuolar protein sorting-associated protein 13A/C
VANEVSRRGSSMLSAAMAGLISKYLGDFVEIAPDQLSVGLLAGELNVENLRFRAEALRDLNLPITVKEGVVGRLKVQVPWTSLWSSPTRVVLEDIYLVAEHTEAVFDKDFDKRAAATKERLLQPGRRQTWRWRRRSGGRALRRERRGRRG